jgi:ABC-type antimicrobial peptide transport system permease subunit
MRAVGFRTRTVSTMLLLEHGILLDGGMFCGVVAGVVASLPAILSPGMALPVIPVIIVTGAVLLNGMLWTVLASRAALRGDLLTPLRNE